jgi:uncharacterized membrane protein
MDNIYILLIVLGIIIVLSIAFYFIGLNIDKIIENIKNRIKVFMKKPNKFFILLLFFIFIFSLFISIFILIVNKNDKNFGTGLLVILIIICLIIIILYILLLILKREYFFGNSNNNNNMNYY